MQSLSLQFLIPDFRQTHKVLDEESMLPSGVCCAVSPLEAWIAQSVEHQTFNLRVQGSSPCSGGALRTGQSWFLLVSSCWLHDKYQELNPWCISRQRSLLTKLANEVDFNAISHWNPSKSLTALDKQVPASLSAVAPKSCGCVAVLGLFSSLVFW